MSTDTDGTPAETDDEPIVERRPTVKPVAIKLTVVALATLLVVALLARIDGVSLSVTLVPAALGGLLILRYLLQMIILRQTTYAVMSDKVLQKFSLLFRQEVKVLPLQQLRGYEVTKSRSETLLGYGTIRFLTEGSGRGIGVVSFDHVDQPTEIGDRVLEHAGRDD